MSAPYRLAAYLGLVQFLFALCWTAYVVYLPGLLEAAGLPRRWAPWILLVDQMVFALTDLAMGLAADRVRAVFGRIAPWILALTLISCLAFALLPLGAAAGGAGAHLLLGLILVWAATSSALRAPPWLLFARYVPTPRLPLLAALNLTGLALASAMAPYLTLHLRGVDPRLPLALASGALALTVAGLVIGERIGNRAPAPGADAPTGAPERPAAASVLAMSFGAAVLLGAGFQAHVFLSSGPLYLRFAAADELDRWLPVFWVGFSIAVFPGAGLAARLGLGRVLVGATWLAAAGALYAWLAGSLAGVAVGQLIAGAGWGCALTALTSSALRLGLRGREGLALGLVWSALAVAAMARFGVVLAELPKAPEIATLVSAAAPLCWAAAGVVLHLLVRRAPHAYGRPSG